MTATQTTAIALPLEPGTWTLDKNHSSVDFVIRHLGLSNVRGRFDGFDASLEVGDALTETVVTADVDMNSVDTNQPDRDAHLKSTDFFSADAHPHMTFRSAEITGDGSDYELSGDLTINGITKPVTFDVEFNGREVFPGDGQVHAGFSARADIRRNDYGIDFNMPLGMGKLALGEKVKIELELQFVAPSGGDAS